MFCPGRRLPGGRESAGVNLTYAYSQYLAAKKTVDDRALNKEVVQKLGQELAEKERLSILEIGAGLGTMIGRWAEWRLLRPGTYTLLDVDGQLLEDSRRWLCDQGLARFCGSQLEVDTPSGPLAVFFLQSELSDYLQSARRDTVDLLIGNAFLDLVDVPETLPGLFEAVKPGGLCWFSINFDGETIFQPEDPRDEVFMNVYHRTMDERLRYGRQAGESKAGRHLFHHIRAAGGQVLAMGASDWVVHPLATGGYPAEEASFLRFILETIETALRGQAEIDEDQLAGWLKLRQGQLAGSDLVYIAHQLDLLARTPS